MRSNAAIDKSPEKSVGNKAGKATGKSGTSKKKMKKEAGTQAELSPDLLAAMYQDMAFYRRIEERINLAYTKQKFSGFCHLHIGQEALCVGVQKALRETDYMISGYRSHTQAIAKGIPAGKVMAELFGKVDGCSRGKGGSMHMFSKEHRFLGGHGIVGGQVPIAAGVGFAIKYRKEDDIMVCYLGDAAVNQGQFFEALNMAATWNLPVLFIIENNGYGMGTDIKRTTSIENLEDRALGFAMDHSKVDGMNVITTYEHMRKVIANIRKTSRPHLCNALTYRYKGHSVSDPGTYRTKDEVKSYMERDPIKTLGAYLTKNKLFDSEQLDDWDKQAKQKAKDAEAFADASSPADPSEAFDHVLV